MNAIPFLVAGYGLTFAAILGYLWRLGRLEARLERLEGRERG